MESDNAQEDNPVSSWSVERTERPLDERRMLKTPQWVKTATGSATRRAPEQASSNQAAWCSVTALLGMDGRVGVGV